MEKIIRETDEALTAFQNIFSSVNFKQINKLPFDGSWSAGQLAQHIILVNSGFTELLGGFVEETNRPADHMIERLRDDLLNFKLKMDSPDSVLPEDKNYDKEELIEKLKEIRTDILEAVNNLDLTKTCKTFELRVYGFLTRLEAIYFVIYHTQRHTHQLIKIFDMLNGKALSDYADRK